MQTAQFLENMTLKDSFEKDNFFRKLSTLLEQFPKDFNKYKVLPQLVAALDYGAANSRILGPLLKIGTQLTKEEYAKLVTPSVSKWFASKDKNLRMNLLQNLEHFSDHLPAETVNSDIFPSIATGFLDPNPKLRELTLRSMLHLVPKLTEGTINNHLMKYLARLQMDPEPGIRANTTVCLGKISVHLSPATKQKILIAALSRALRDPFPPARVAGLAAFVATVNDYSPAECAIKILPLVVPLMVDPETSVRSKAFACGKIFFSRLEDAHNGVVTKPATKSEQKEAVGMLSWAWDIGKKIVTKGESEQTSPGGETSTPQQRPGDVGSMSTSTTTLPRQGHSAATTSPQVTSSLPHSATTSHLGKGGNTGGGFSDEDFEEDGGWDDFDEDEDEEPAKSPPSSSASQSSSVQRQTSRSTPLKSNAFHDMSASSQKGKGAGAPLKTAHTPATSSGWGLDDGEDDWAAGIHIEGKQGSQTQNTALSPKASTSSAFSADTSAWSGGGGWGDDLSDGFGSASATTAATGASKTSFAAVSDGWGDSAVDDGWGNEDDDADWGSLDSEPVQPASVPQPVAKKPNAGASHAKRTGSGFGAAPVNESGGGGWGNDDDSFDDWGSMATAPKPAKLDRKKRKGKAE